MSVDVWIEAALTFVRCPRVDFRWLRGVVVAEFEAELEEAILVGGVRCANDESFDVANVGLLAGYCKS